MPTTPKVPVLSDSDIHEAESAFLKDVMRELAIEGYPSGGRMHADLVAARDHLTVQPYITGPGVRYFSPRGQHYMASARDVAMDLIAAKQHREQLLTFGPDPVTALVDRLKSLGVPADEAKERAEQRIARQDDGRVFVHRGQSDGKPREFGSGVKKGQEYTPEQLAALDDHGAAVSHATRLILDERERGIDANGTPADYRPPTRAEEMARHRNAAASFF